MRTTLTLDEDVAAKLQEEMRRHGGTFKETVNRMLRLGLNAPPGLAPRERFEVRPRALQARPGISYDNVAELLDQLEDTEYR